MCKVNKLFTIKRVSVYVFVYTQMEGQIDVMSGWGCVEGSQVVDGLGLQLVRLGRVKLGLGDRGDGNWGGVKL